MSEHQSQSTAEADAAAFNATFDAPCADLFAVPVSDKTIDNAPNAIRVRVDAALTDPQVVNLLREHLAGMFAESPPDKVYALDLSALRQPDITFLTAWRQSGNSKDTGEGGAADGEAVDQLMACGALKELDPAHGEIKSMRTSALHLRQGAAQAVLTELLAIARRRGYEKVSLETGTTPGFDAAVAMYRRFGFVDCGPFADYREDPFSRFVTRVHF
jgi:putative acetyltransferase